MELGAFLPGKLVLARGTVLDYRELERFHYRAKSPASWAGVWVVRYEEHFTGGPPVPRETSRVVAAAVLSYPTVNSSARDLALGLGDWEPRRRLSFVNANVRAISRVVVHPQFRSLGLAAALVREVCRQCPTRFVEAFAVMGRVHPFFEKGGMKCVAANRDRPVYYLFDRRAAAARE